MPVTIPAATLAAMSADDLKALEKFLVSENGSLVLSAHDIAKLVPAESVERAKAGLLSAPPKAMPPAVQSGPGTELKALLSKIGITATPTCSCNARATTMDENEAREPGWCEANIDTIVSWLREEAAQRGLPFVDVAGRLLVRRAIANARRKEAARGTEDRPPLHAER